MKCNENLENDLELMTENEFENSKTKNNSTKNKKTKKNNNEILEMMENIDIRCQECSDDVK